MKTSLDRLRSGIAVVFIWTASALPGFAAEARCGSWVARAASIQGKVDVRRYGEALWKEAREGHTFCQGDVIRVGRDSRAALALFNDTILRLNQNTTVILPAPQSDGGFWVDLIVGVLHLVSRVSSELEIRTPFVTAGLEGTEFVLAVNEAATTLNVIEGHVAFSNRHGRLSVGTGQSARSDEDHAPVMTLPVLTDHSVVWAMHYPRLHGPDADSRFRWLVEAQQALQLGQVERAREALSRAPDLPSAKAEALALRAVIAIVQNRRQAAMELAEASRRFAPDGASSLLALSYAQQANRDLKGAAESAARAVRKHPDNGLLWARHAEMLLATDAPAQASHAARRAVQLEPQASRAHLLLGFAALANRDDEVALAAFDRAVSLDSADPMPRLGRGLLLVQAGDLAEGRREMEIALSLAPGNALVRSYLGKAYDAENRPQRAETQYALAKSLDPQDPTAYFYEALLRHATNRPVEALQSLTAALARNDNRRVYRSGLAADQDAAARNAAIARIFDSLGYEEQADQAIAAALATDPSDYAAHRFRADTLASDDRQTLARASEVLQSQLLQPLNLYPVPPALAQSNVDILRNAGPQSGGINEFNPLFVRDQAVFQLSAVAGSDDTLGDEALVGLLRDDWAISAGQFHYETAGFRPNADVKEDIYTLFAQHRINASTSVQAEVRRHEQSRGDIGLYFSPDVYSDNRRQRQRDDSTRFGIRHQVNPGALLLGSLIYVEQRKRDKSQAPVPSTPFTSSSDQRSDDKGYLAEAQYLGKTTSAAFVAGIGYYENAVNDVTDVEVTLGPSVVADDRFTTDITETHTNAYGYGFYRVGRSGRLVAGLSVDELDSAPFERRQLNPKLGLLWDLSGATRLRLAAFRTLQRSLVSDQTLEPTQVAGFTQFWDDSLGTDARAAAAALDHQVDPRTTIGVYALYRRLDVPVQNPDDSVGAEHHIDRRMGGYLNWTPTDRVATALGYRYESRRRRQTANVTANEPLGLTSHQAPLSVSYHHPSGWFGQLVQTYHRQKSRIKTSTSSPPDIQSSTFWLTDLEAGLRLSKRRGIVSVQVRNLFDRSFSYRDTDFATGAVQAPQIQPSRAVFVNLVIPLH